MLEFTYLSQNICYTNRKYVIPITVHVNDATQCGTRAHLSFNLIQYTYIYIFIQTGSFFSTGCKVKQENNNVNLNKFS